MNKTLTLLNEEFESSPFQTQQYLKFHRQFKKDFTKLLSNCNCQDVVINKPNHFDVFGWFTKEDQKWYFSLSDLRSSYKYQLLVRQVKHYKDYVGGHNNYCKIDNRLEDSLNRVMGE